MAIVSKIITKRVGKVTVVNFIDTAITDTQQIQHISRELENLIDEKECRFMVLDFSSVRFLSSQTLGMLLKLHKKLSDKSGWMGLAGLKPELKKIFKLTRLDRIFNFYDTPQDAIDAALAYGV